MGLWEFLRQWPRGRRLAGVLVSVLLHSLLAGAVLWVKPSTTFTPRPGDTLFVELPRPDEPAAAGSPGASAPPSPPPPPAVRPAPPAPPAARPAPPAPPPPKAAPAPRAPAAVARAEPAAPPAPPAPVTPELPKAPEPPPVASAPPEPRMPEPRAPEPAPAPPAEAAPAPPAPAPAPAAAEPAAAEPPAAPPRPVEAQAEARRGDGQVASVPPTPAPSPAPDIRSLRRGGGAGGQGGPGRGGVEGEPIPLDSRDPKYSDYLEQVRRKIKANWGYPCVRDPQTRECDYKTTQLLVEFGISKDGRVPFVNVVRSSGYRIYDDYAVNAILLSSPFPRIPDSFSRTGVPIHATFHYVVESSLTNLLR